MFTRAEGKSPGDCCPLQTCDLNVSLFVQQDAEREGRKQMLYKRPGQLWDGVQTSAAQQGSLGSSPHAGVTCSMQMWASGFTASPVSSFCWVAGGFRSTVFGVNQAKAGTCRFETFFSPQEGSGTLQTILHEERD